MSSRTCGAGVGGGQWMRVLGALAALGMALGLASCKQGDSGGKGEVVLYTSVDEPVARPIVAEFEKRTGIKVKLVTDTEASKTSGLVQRVRAEKANAQADVFWNNEPFHAISLAEEGVLAAYESPSAKDVPAAYKDAKGRWTGVGLRVRMIATHPGVTGVSKIEDLVNPAKVPVGERPTIGMGFPALGTISGHLAALRLAWGPERYEKFLKDLEPRVKLLGGNSEVVKEIARGNLLAGLTDNDDIDEIAREAGPGKVLGVPAATAEGGTLAIPSTVGLVAGAKHDANAKQLIDYLTSAEVEQKLIAAHYSLRGVRAGGATTGPAVMQLDYLAAAKLMPEAVAKARAVLEGKRE